MARLRTQVAALKGKLDPAADYEPQDAPSNPGRKPGATLARAERPITGDTVLPSRGKWALDLLRAAGRPMTLEEWSPRADARAPPRTSRRRVVTCGGGGSLGGSLGGAGRRERLTTGMPPTRGMLRNA